MPAGARLPAPLLDAVADALDQLGLDHVALLVDRDLDDHVALHAWGRSARETGGSGKTSGSAGMISSPVSGDPGTRAP